MVTKLPRKTKKALKNSISASTNYSWDSREIKITSTERNSRYKDLRPTFKGITATGFTLGI